MIVKNHSFLPLAVLIMHLLNQYSPVPRARSSIVGVGVARAQIYAGLGNHAQLCGIKGHSETLVMVDNRLALPLAVSIK